MGDATAIGIGIAVAGLVGGALDGFYLALTGPLAFVNAGGPFAAFGCGFITGFGLLVVAVDQVL